LEVDANFRRGSFEFELIAVPLLVGNQLLGGFSIADIDRVLRWLGLIGEGEDSLFGLLKRNGPKPVEVVGREGDSVHVTIQGQHVTYNHQVIRLAQDPRIRRDVEEVTEPVRSPGITEFKSGAAAPNTVLADEATADQFIAPPTLEGTLTDSVVQMAMELIAPSFQEGNMWRFRVNTSTIYATIQDEIFLAEVQSGDRTFGKGDFLVGQVRIQTYIDQGRVKATYEITKVEQHVRGGTQGTLFASGEDRPPPRFPRQGRRKFADPDEPI
jgi:hypothetical protein